MALKISLHIRFLIKTISISLLIVSCSPQKRLSRLVKNHPELITLDTVRIVDTIVVENYSFDTITRIQFHDSTIIINNERIFARYFYDTLRQEIIHEIECKNDTIFYEKLIPIEKVVVQELTWWEKYGSIVIISGILILTLVVLKRFGKVLL